MIFNLQKELKDLNNKKVLKAEMYSFDEARELIKETKKQIKDEILKEIRVEDSLFPEVNRISLTTIFRIIERVCK